MERGVIVLISDRSDRSSSLAEAIRDVAECRIVGSDENWNDLAPAGQAPIWGAIADIGFGRPDGERCLRRFAGARRGAAVPVLLLTRGSADTPIVATRELGVSLCLPAHTDPAMVVDALIRQVWPGLSQVDFVVRRGAVRAGMQMFDMFQAAKTGPVDMAAVERSLAPVIDAIGQGGLSRWLTEVWTLDDLTFQHCLLVAGLAAAFSRNLGLSRSDQHLMTRAALVHDVGKARIPLAILNKPGRLDDEEMAVMHTHAVIGHDILQASGGCDATTLAMARHHHEMLDGSGYPDGLSGPEIGDPVRLLTICDIYSALIERRPYKEPVSSREALRILSGMTGKLEGGLVQAFSKTVSEAA